MFHYLDGQLHAERVRLSEIAGAAGTPVYVYSSAVFASRFREFTEGLAGIDHLICYAMKANSNQAILRLLLGLGSGFDAVSAGEIERAAAAGAPGGRIVFSGVGKTGTELRQALDTGVRHFNVESEPELAMLSEIAASSGRVAPVAIRVNPDIDAGTHHKISTGKAENKFGVPVSRVREVYRQAAQLPGLRIVGLDMHIGSQITALAPFEAAFRRAAELVAQLRADGHRITRLDVGGGLGISYGDSDAQLPDAGQYCRLLQRTLAHLECEIEIEPGRYIAGPGGVLLTTVLYAKQGEGRRFLIVDAAMNDLHRTAIYGAWHDIQPLRQPRTDADPEEVDIVGPVCESSDTFARGRAMPPTQAGQLLAIRSAGAYGAVMASEYNTRALVPEVLVQDDRFAVVRSRPSIADIIARDIMPDWL
ncbi:MAG: diaminopimelate decarboxylase [Rhodobacteraceae bacterium]|nr:diaminopimelate decarboxylase [Paracoccaceae bacterium]